MYVSMCACGWVGGWVLRGGGLQVKGPASTVARKALDARVQCSRHRTRPFPLHALHRFVSISERSDEVTIALHVFVLA